MPYRRTCRSRPVISVSVCGLSLCRWYWAGDEHGQRTWLQLSRIGDEVFEITARTDSWQQVVNMANGRYNTLTFHSLRCC